MKRWKIVLPIAATLFAGCVFFYSNTDSNTATGSEGLSGTLVDDQGAPVANAVIKAFAVGATDTLMEVTTSLDSLWDSAQDSTYTNASGRFKFSRLKNGDYNLVGKIHKGDSTRVVSHRGVHHRGSTDVGRDTVKTPGIILISALWKSEPLRGVRCSVIGAAAAAVSDDSGRCLLANVAPGNFQIRMMREGFFPSVTGDVRVRSDKITYAGSVEMVPIPAGKGCWKLTQSNGYLGLLKVSETGNQLDGTIDWQDLRDGHHFAAVISGIDSVTRIYFVQHQPGDTALFGYYWGDVRGDSLLNGIGKSSKGDHCTWFAARTACDD